MMQPQNAFEKYLQKVKIRPLPKGIRVLEIGCGDGSVFEGTEYTVDGYDIDEEALSKAKLVPNYRLVSSNLQDFNQYDYDCICLLGVLEHLSEDQFDKILAWATLANEVYITVPNAHSFHRQVGVELGIISNLHELTEADYTIGHTTYFSIYTLFRRIAPHVNKNNLLVSKYGTLGFKWDKSVDMVPYIGRMDAIERVAIKCGLIGSGKQHGAEIFVHLKRKDG